MIAYLDDTAPAKPTHTHAPRATDTETTEQKKWRIYERLCQQVMRQSSDLRWKQGDLALVGERMFPENYMQALTGKFGLEQRTIENRMRVARKFPKTKQENKRLWDVDFMWYETLAAKDWDTIVEHMDKVESGEYENREQLRAVFRDDSEEERYTTCKVTSISDILLEHFPDDTDVELTIKGKVIRIKIVDDKQTTESEAAA